MSKEIKELENLRNGLITIAVALVGGFIKKKIDEKQASRVSEEEIVKMGKYKLVKEEKAERNR